MRRLDRFQVALAGLLAVVLLLGAGTVLLLRDGPDDALTVTAEFANPIGVYVGNPVTVLGVQVGKVTGLDPDGTVVHVTVQLQEGVQLPRDVQAAVVQPSLVNSRTIAFTPAYTGGPALEDGATLGGDRTFAPVELDEILVALQELSVALGPEGANSGGSVNSLLQAGASVLDGQGQQANRTITQLAGLLETLDTDREDVATIVTNLADVLGTLAASGTTITAFEQNLAGAASILADERENFAAMTRELGLALGQLGDLVRDNRDEVGSSVQALARVSETLVSHQRDLMETLDVLPLALANVDNAIDPETGRLDVRLPAEDFAAAFCFGVLNNSLPLAPELLDLLRALPGVDEVSQQSCTAILTALLPVLGELSALPADEALGELSRLLDLLPVTGLVGELVQENPAAPSAADPVPELGLRGLLDALGSQR